ARPPSWRMVDHRGTCAARARFKHLAATAGLRNELLVLAEHRPGAALAFRLLQEAHADLVALDVDQLALAVGVADRRQHEEELVELDVLDAALDRDLGAALRDHLDVALAPPSAVDPHDARLEARLEHDLVGALEFSFLAHGSAFPHARGTRGRTRIRIGILAQDSESAVNAGRAGMLNGALPPALLRARPRDTPRQARAAPRRGRSCRRR